MKKRSHLISTFISLLLLFLLMSSNTISACSGFVLKKDDTVLIGHNKDWWNPETTVYIYPSEPNVHGRLFFEIPFPHPFNSDYRVLCGGVNDQGLCFESFVTPFKLASFKPFKPPLFENPVDDILKQFSTVEEVIDFIESHNLFFLNYILAFGQLFVVDRTGDAVIVEGDELIRISKDYQICTNFLQSSPDRGGYPCWRYEYLINALENETDPTIPYFTSLLEYVELYAQYSWILNPIDLTLYVYHFRDYDRAIQFNLREEFKKQAYSFELSSLFEPADNTAPDKPITPLGPTSAGKKQAIVFETNTTDDNKPSEIFYKWDFGDGTITDWSYNYQTYRGTSTHKYRQTGNYQVQVKAKDIYGKESPWSDPLEVRINRNNQKLLRLKFFIQTIIDSS